LIIVNASVQQKALAANVFRSFDSIIYDK